MINEEKNITIVTGFYNINRESWVNSPRSVDHYLQSFANYLTLPYKMVIFMDDRYPLPSSPGKTVIPINMAWLTSNTASWNKLDRATTITNSGEYRRLIAHRSTQPQNCQPKYCIINHTKIDFIKYAIDHKLIDPDDFVIWSDFGYHNSILHLNPAEFPSRTLDIKRFNVEKLCFFLYDRLQQDDFDPIKTLRYPHVTFTGSLWGGPQHLLLKLHDVYHQSLDYMHSINISDFDQHVFVQCFMRSPDMFELYVSNRTWPQILTEFQLR